MQYCIGAWMDGKHGKRGGGRVEAELGMRSLEFGV